MLTLDLLDHVASGVLRDRAKYIEGSDGELWSNTTLLNYLNEAENRFARGTFCILDDSTSAVVTVPLVASTASYALHKSILKVFSVTLSDSPVRLAAKSYTHLSDTEAEMVDGLGRPTGYWVDTSTRKIRFAAIPYTDEVGLSAKLRVARLPLAPMVISATSVPEIPEEYHLALCDWVVYRALMHQETDSEAQVDGHRFRATFENEIKSARRDIQILTEPPSQIKFGTW